MNKVLFILFFFLSCTNFAFALDYDFYSTFSIPVKMSIQEEISTKEGLLEGTWVNFKIIEDVYYNKKLIVQKGDIAKAKIATVVTSGMNGFPAEIFIEDFKINGIEQSKLKDTYVKTGTNRCLWGYPIKWALTPIPGVGSLTNLIKGGHAKIKTTDIITLKYYPEWR